MGKLCQQARRVLIVATSLFSLGITGPSWAQSPKIIELFTSHGCSSCPAADRLLGELIEADENLIALEFHVDYWNALVHGSDGNWVDPFSKAAYTTRQKNYNRLPLAGRQGVYTPQAIVNGKFAAVGSDKKRLSSALKQAGPADVIVSIATAAGQLEISVEGTSQRQANIMLLHYIRQATTKIGAGENRHLALTNHHIVTDVQTLGQLSDSGSTTVSVAYAPDPDKDCAVVVQSPGLGPILGAAQCP